MGSPDPSGGHTREQRQDDLLHPVRHLRSSLSGPVDDRLDGWARPAAPAPPAEDTVTVRPRQRRTLLVALALAAVVGAASGVVALTQASPHAPFPRATPGQIPVVAAPGVPTAAPGAAVGDLSMYTETTGWAQRLSDGAVLHTTRGVQSWSLASPPSGDRILAVAFVDAETARALTVPAGASGDATVQSWATADGGVTWSQGGSFSVQAMVAGAEGGLDFVDAEDGWFSQTEGAAGISGMAVFRTTNGGGAWTRVAETDGIGAMGSKSTGVIPTDCAALQAAFVSATTGWLTGSCAAGAPPFLLTEDGGVTWTAQALPSLAASSGGDTTFPPTFTSAQTGTMLVEETDQDQVSVALYTTADGGHTWTLKSIMAGTALGADFIDADRGWLVTTDPEGTGAAPDIFSTADGGSTWDRLNAFPFIGVRLDFLTSSVGWAATDIGQVSEGVPTALFQTLDGGRNWTAVTDRISVPPGSHSPSPSP